MKRRIRNIDTCLCLLFSFLKALRFPEFSIVANRPYLGGTVPIFYAKFPTVLIFLDCVPIFLSAILSPNLVILTIFNLLASIFCYFLQIPLFSWILSLFLIVTGWQL